MLLELRDAACVLLGLPLLGVTVHRTSTKYIIKQHIQVKYLYMSSLSKFTAHATHQGQVHALSFIRFDSSSLGHTPRKLFSERGLISLIGDFQGQRLQRDLL